MHILNVLQNAAAESPTNRERDLPDCMSIEENILQEAVEEVSMSIFSNEDAALLSGITSPSPSPIATSTPSSARSSVQKKRNTDEVLLMVLESMEKRDKREERALEQQAQLTAAILKMSETIQKLIDKTS